MPDPRISVLILARDEQENLLDCVRAARWADEIVILVDASSQDDTEAIARENADVVAVRPFDDFASQRNAALALATGDWVFAIDADERATPALAEEVRRAISDRAGFYAGFRVGIQSIILGRRFGYSGTQHDVPLRLFRREAGRWVGAVHETVDILGRIGTLEQALQHRTIPDMRTFLRKIDHYTTLEAIKFEREGRKPSRVDLTIRPMWTFVKLFVGKQGFRDGMEGFAFCALSGVSEGVRHWKYRERLKQRRAS